jgi:phage terminase large subunit
MHLRGAATKFRRLLSAKHGTKGEPESDPDVFLQPNEAYAEIIGGPFDATDFNFRRPDYSEIFQRRTDALAILQERPGLLVPVKKYYADHPADFITDWANRFNLLNRGQGLPTTLPFVLFERQREWIDYVLRKWHARERGLTEKSREVGMSWLAIGFSSAMCLFHWEFVVGFGSYKKEYVDEAGDPKSLFWKARFFIEHLPAEFRGSWEKARHAPQFRIFFPDSGSVIFGDVGDELGRGGRSALFFVDEAARLAHPELVEASLSFTTNCRMDISTPNGLANTFYQNRTSGRIEVFTFPWRSDPRKDDAWYQEQKLKKDPIVLA